MDKRKILKKLDLEWFLNSPVRKGSYIGKNVVLMPCFVNIGAYIDEGTMMDTFQEQVAVVRLEKIVIFQQEAGVGRCFRTNASKRYQQ